PSLINAAHAQGVKILVSVGGASATYDANFRTVAASAALRNTFADNLEAHLRAYGYDGVDLDWEFPRNAADRNNFNLLIQAVHSKFNSSPAPAPSWIISSVLP